MNESEFELVEGSGTVFRDFGDPDADLKPAESLIAARIIAVLDEAELAVRKAQDMTGFAAADFSRIRDASLARFTLDRPIRILAALDGLIRVTVHIDPRWIGAAATQFPGRRTLRFRTPRFRAVRARRNLIRLLEAQTLTWRLGIDIGGTFTDFALLDEETGQIAIHKQLTTPLEPSECVLDGARNILAARGVDFSDVHTVVHGTTLVTNALD